MNTELKREWVFDGTRGEFWTFVIVTAFYCTLVIRSVVTTFGGVGPNKKVSSNPKYSVEEAVVLTVAFVAFLVLAITLRVLGRWFTIAFAVKSVETAAKLVFGYGMVSGPAAFGALVLLNCISTVLFFIAFLSYIAKRLRREPLSSATESNPE